MTHDEACQDWKSKAVQRPYMKLLDWGLAQKTSGNRITFLGEGALWLFEIIGRLDLKMHLFLYRR
jgi:hypothetical protein